MEPKTDFVWGLFTSSGQLLGVLPSEARAHWYAEQIGEVEVRQITTKSWVGDREVPEGTTLPNVTPQG